MTEIAPVFARIIEDYLNQVRNISEKEKTAASLAITATAKGYTIPFFYRDFSIADDGITAPDDSQPQHAVSVILCKYLLLCPSVPSSDHSLVTFKDFRNAAPFVGGFRSNAEQVISTSFTNGLSALEQRCVKLGGTRFATEVSCQLAYRFQALPKVPVFLLFNDADEEFPAQSTVLFQRNAASYLDMECLAMVGSILAYRLQG